jgi:long-subunit fatty acid transport protein
MKSVKIMLVVFALLITVSAFCEGVGIVPMSARQLGMGGAGIAVADDAFAWTQNPAGLASLATKPKEGAKWSWDVAGSYTQSSDLFADTKVKAWDIDFGACDPAEGMGFGAGWADAKIDPVKLDIFGAGFGMKVRSESCKGLAWGVNVQRAKLDSDSANSENSFSGSKTLFNAGLMYEVPIAENKAIKLGLVVNDVTNELDDAVGNIGNIGNIGNVGNVSNIATSFVGRTWSMGFALPVSDKLTLAVDNRGIGQVLHIWSAGLEWKSNGWAVRAGDWDGSLTVGAGYRGKNWYIDAAYGNSPTNKVVNLLGGPTVNFTAVTVGANF